MGQNEVYLAHMGDIAEEQFPIDILDYCKHRDKYFKQDGMFISAYPTWWMCANLSTGTFIHADAPRKSIASLRLMFNTVSSFKNDEREVEGVLEFLKRYLRLRPGDRATAKELADDPWVKLE